MVELGTPNNQMFLMVFSGKMTAHDWQQIETSTSDVTDIEDITWPRGDMKFLFEYCKIFHEWAQQMSEIFFQHEKYQTISLK